MENKNLLIAVALSVGFLFLWSTFVVPRYAPKPAPVASAPTVTGGAQPAQEILGPAHVSATPAKDLKDTLVRDAQNEIVFSPAGGSIEHWRLMIKNQEVDLVDKPAVLPLPLSTYPDATFSVRLLSRPGDAKPNATPAGAQAQGVLPNGVRLTKTLTLSQEGFLHDLSFKFTNPTSQPVNVQDFQWGWGPGLGTSAAERKENGGLTRALSMGKLKIRVLKAGEYEDFGAWSGIDNRYFLVAVLPTPGTQAKLSVKGTKENTQFTVRESITVPARGETTLAYQLYVGPKGYTQLGKYKKSLEEAVDFGFFSPVGKVVLQTLYWLQRHTGNYGWAIILLTLILQILLLPLTIKSFKATMAMKTLQPHIAALQKNYKSDPKRLNLEMMNLYKKSGTNPFGGCLPMVAQLPLFWALFTTLRNAYELRGTPFIGWIHDLSVADPYHILPIVMGGGMFLQQRMSGAVTDPTQKQMMMIMPVMFTVMFFNFPAGLVLYWLTQNIVTMIIQWGLLRYNEQKPALTVH